MNPKFEIDFGSGYATEDPPINWKDMKLEAIFTSEHPSASLQSINFEWGPSTSKKINTYVLDGLKNGGRGILEGPALRISLDTYVLPICVLDLPNAASLYECDIIKTPIKRIQSIDWFLDQASSFNFSYLQAQGIITPADFKKIPFLITNLLDMAHLLMMLGEEAELGVTIFREVQSLIQLGTKLGTDIAAATTFSPAAIAGILYDILALALEIVYIIFLLVSIINLFSQVVNQVYQTKKYKLGMRVEDLILKGLQQIDPNMQFSSTILRQGIWKDLTIVPKKIMMPKVNQNGNLSLNLFDRAADENGNSNAYGYPDHASFKLFLDDMKTMFNASDKVYSNKYEFEEKHFWLKNAGFTLPNQGDPGYTFLYPEPHGVNVNELASTYVLQYPLDSTDFNTIQRYRGTTCSVSMQPIVVGDPKRLLLPGFTNIIFPFAQTKRKEYLSTVEQAVNTLITGVIKAFNVIQGIINGIIGVLNGITKLINKIANFFGVNITIPAINSVQLLPFGLITNNRIGWMELSNDTFDIPKIFMGVANGNDWEIDPANENLMSAFALMNNFHGKNLITRGNQWLTYRDKKFKMCLADFLKIINNNVFTTADNRIGKFEKILWNIYDNEALSVDYRINQNYTNNLKETITIDGN